MTPLIDLESVRTHWRSGHDGADLARRLGVVKIDKGLEIKLGAISTIANITHLAEHGKARAVLVLCDPDIFFGEKAEAKPDPDQTNLLDKAA